MKSVYHILTMICLVVTLTVAGLLGWLAVAGRFSPENSEVLGRMVRGEALFDPAEEAPTTQPATRRPANIAAQTDLLMSEQAVMRTDLLTRRSREELKYKTRQLESMLARVKSERALLAKERIEWAKQIEAVAAEKNDVGFQRELQMYEKMDARKAKDVLFELPEELAARFLAEMKAQVRAEIVSNVRSDSEKLKLQRLLSLMREV